MLRCYQIFSTAYAVYAVIRLTVVLIIKNQWLDMDPVYACYIPGRLGLVVCISDHFALFGLIIYIGHLAYRSTWYLIADRLDLDCFIFLCHDEGTIIEKQFAVAQLNDCNLAPEVALERYVSDKLFYQRQVDTRGRSSYAMKQHRTIKRYRLLKNLLIKYRFLYLILNGTLVAPAYIYRSYFQFSHELFDYNYHACRSFSSRRDAEDFSWSFGDTFRLVYLFFDLLDNLMFFLDGSIAVTIPYNGTILVTNDLTYRFDALSRRMSNLNDVLRSNDCVDLSYESLGGSSPTVNCIRFLESIEEANCIYHEIMSIFDHMGRVDEYIRRLAMIVFAIWFSSTIAIATMSMVSNSSVDGSIIVFYTYIQINSHVLFMCAFCYMSHLHNRTRVLYKEICSAMALSPDIRKTKWRWRWLLEYYHRSSTRHTLHLVGKSYALSNLNVLRCMSWFATCSMLIVNLIKNARSR